MNRIAFVLSSMAGILAISAISASSSGSDLLVGPNILVSNESWMTHFELSVAANPRNSQNIVGTGMTLTGRNHGINTRVYTSLDGGNTWTDSQFEAMYAAGDSWDPIVAFTPSGTAILTALTPDPNPAKALKHLGDIWVYRSTDGGQRWKNTALLTDEDHEQVTTDATNGPYHGSIYISGMMVRKKACSIGVFRSRDDGRTFAGPVFAHTVKGCGNTSDPVVLPDGSLLATFYDYPKISKHPAPGLQRWPFGFSLSKDGGKTFGPPKYIATQFGPANNAYFAGYFRGKVDQTTSPAFGVDLSNGPYRGRIYAAWGDYRYGDERVLYSFSADGGAHWSPARPIDPQSPSGSVQYQAEVAVNSDGVAAVTWSDNRGFPSTTIGYKEYIAISKDGGDSFSAPRSVSSAASYPIALGNIPGNWSANQMKDGLKLFLFSGFDMRRAGGDYMGLTAAGSAFHPFWIDNRDGSALIYSATVLPNDNTTQTASADATPVDVSKDVSLVADPVRFDAATNTLIVPVRLRNTSKEPLRAPISIRVDTLAFDQRDIETGPFRVTAAQKSADGMWFTNAGNGKRGTGATFDYSTALGDFTALAPGEVTEAIPWRMHVSSRAFTAPVFSVHVFAAKL